MRCWGDWLTFDRVIEAIGPIVEEDTNAFLFLRSGSIFFSDHGIYRRGWLPWAGKAAKERVSALRSFKPALKLWAEILSVPEPGLAI